MKTEESETKSIETMKIMGTNGIGNLVKQNEELKAQIRELLSIDQEEPYEKIEEYRGRIIDLENENERLKSDKSKLQGSIKNFMNSAIQNNYKIESLSTKNAELDGALKQANETIDKLMEGLFR